MIIGSLANLILLEDEQEEEHIIDQMYDLDAHYKSQSIERRRLDLQDLFPNEKKLLELWEKQRSLQREPHPTAQTYESYKQVGQQMEARIKELENTDTYKNAKKRSDEKHAAFIKELEQEAKAKTTSQDQAKNIADVVNKSASSPKPSTSHQYNNQKNINQGPSKLVNFKARFEIKTKLDKAKTTNNRNVIASILHWLNTKAKEYKQNYDKIDPKNRGFLDKLLYYIAKAIEFCTRKLHNFIPHGGKENDLHESYFSLAEYNHGYYRRPASYYYEPGYFRL